MAERHFYAASMDYVYLIQEVHERKKFEFVETLLTFVYAYFTFYHQVSQKFQPFCRIQKLKILFFFIMVIYRVTKSKKTSNHLWKIYSQKSRKPERTLTISVKNWRNECLKYKNTRDHSAYRRVARKATCFY